MPDAATGGALSGAVSGAAAGTAVLPGIGTLIGAGIGGLGGLLSGSGTKSAQNAANAAAQQAAAMQSAQSFANYLSSRGISLQQIAAANPRFQTEFARIQAAGDKRDFQTWLFDHLRQNPTDPAWQQINTGSVGAQNTTLPAWAVDANGNPLQPALLQQLLGISTGANNPATAPIANLATLENVHALLQARPDLAQQLADAGVGNDGRTPEQWLIDHITQTEGANGGGTFTDALRQFAVGRVAPGGPAGAGGNTQTLDPAISALMPNATKTVGSIFDDTYLNQVMGALKPVADSRRALGDTYDQAAKQALDRLLAEQAAERARRGFTGGSSGSDIVRARLMADYAQRGAGARSQADVANASDALNAILTNQNRKISAIGAPATLATTDLALKSALASQPYAELDQLIKRLNAFSINPSSGPSLSTSVASPVINNSQITGGALSSLGSVIANQSQTNQLMALIKALNGGDRSGVGGATTYDDFLKNNPSSPASGGLTGLEGLFAATPTG